MSVTKPTVIIECYDSGVRICDSDKLLANSASYALIESSDSILVGEEAEHQAYLRPREVSTAFWSNLSENSSTKYVVSHAELAFRHLKHLWQLAKCSDQNVILITSANLDKHSLGLLLGICKKLSINVVGMVSNAVLALQQPIENCKVVHLDLLLQNLLITELNQNETGVSLKQPSHVLNVGLQHFNQNCAKTIANKFITETRFDPLHNASDEQQFFDKLQLWLTALKNNQKIECKLTINDNAFSTTIDQQQLQRTNRLLFEEIAAHLNILFHKSSALAIICSASCLQAFGLYEFLSSLPGCAVVQLNEENISESALHVSNEITTGDQIHYINSLTWQNLTPQQIQFNLGAISNISSIPTHILINGHAYSLQKDVFIDNTDASSEPRILLEESADCLCKISTDNVRVEIYALNSKIIHINENAISTVSSVKTGDILKIEGNQIACQFIKVVHHET